MKKRIIVLSASRYSFTDEKTGEVLDGVTVRYVFTDDLVPCESNDQKGYKVAKANMKVDDWDKFDTVPAHYEAEFDMDVDSKGRPSMRVKDLEYAGGFEVKAAGAAK